MAEYQMKSLTEEKKKREIKTGLMEEKDEAELSPYAVDERWKQPNEQEEEEAEDTRVRTDSVKEILEDVATTKEIASDAGRMDPPPLFEKGEPNLQDILRKQDSRNASMLAVLADIMKAYPTFIRRELIEEDKGNPMRVFVTLYDPNGNKVKIPVMKVKKDGDERALWIQIVENAVKQMMSRYEGGALQDMYAGLSDTGKLSSEERKEAAQSGGRDAKKAGVMLFMGKHGLTQMGLDDDKDKGGDDGSVLVYNASPAASVPSV